jgi:hypothetical protein
MASRRSQDESEWTTRKTRIDPRLDAALWPKRSGPPSAKLLQDGGALDVQRSRRLRPLWIDNRVVGVVEVIVTGEGPNDRDVAIVPGKVWDQIRDRAGIVAQLLAVAETEGARGVEAFLATIVDTGPP